MSNIPIKHRPFLNKPVSKMTEPERQAFKDSVVDLVQTIKDDKGITSEYRKALAHALLISDGEEHPKRDSDLSSVFAGGEPDKPENTDIWGKKATAKTAFGKLFE